MSNTQLTSEPVATPKTDAAAFLARQSNASPPTFVVSADFAREQERRIAELESLVATLERSNRRIREKYDRSYP